MGGLFDIVGVRCITTCDVKSCCTVSTQLISYLVHLVRCFVGSSELRQLLFVIHWCLSLVPIYHRRQSAFGGNPLSQLIPINRPFPVLLWVLDRHRVVFVVCLLSIMLLCGVWLAVNN